MIGISQNDYNQIVDPKTLMQDEEEWLFGFDKMIKLKFINFENLLFFEFLNNLNPTNFLNF